MLPRSLARSLASIPRTKVRHVHTKQMTPLLRQRAPHTMSVWSRLPAVRLASTYDTADEAIEEITELFATAKDEFEIAMEETEKVSVYAEEDRAAAREEFDKVQAAYNEVVNGANKEVAEEVKKRIGQRIRELEQGVKAMEELAQNQD